MTDQLFPPDVEIKLFDVSGNVLLVLRGAIKQDDPREVVWEPSEVEREGLYDHAELFVHGVPRGPFEMTFFSNDFHEGMVLSPWCPLRFEEPLV